MAKYYAPALDKGLDIIEFLSSKSIPQSQIEIANGIDRKPNEIYRMLICLENRGYIIKEAVSGKYHLTLRLFQLAHNHSSIDTIVKASDIHLEHLSYNIKQSCHLSVLSQNQLLIIAEATSKTPVSISVEVGSLFPLIKTTSGKVFLAFSSKGKRNKILNTYNDFKKFKSNEKKELEAELESIKKQQYYMHKSSLTLGITDIAFPIFDINNEVLAVLAVSTLTSQMREFISTEKILDEMRSTIKKINTSLGLNKKEE